MEPKTRVGLDLDNVSMAEEMTYSLSTDYSNANVVHICAIRGFQILAIDQGRKVM